MTRQLQQRWTSADGQRLAHEVVAFLVGARRRLPGGIGTHDGRHDLRGLAVSSPRRGAPVTTVGDLTAYLVDGVLEMRRVSWLGLDLSHARLPSLRFFNARIGDCRFEQASCRDWRMWATTCEDSSFAGADLRDAMLGTWQDKKRNEWRRVQFDRADLRGAAAVGCVFEECSFVDSRLKGVQFEQAVLRRCQFAGSMSEVVFDGRKVPGRPAPAPLVDVDFSKASFAEVEFRGCAFDRVQLPAGVHPIPRYPAVVRRALEILDPQDTAEARILKAEFTVALKMPGAEDSVGVFNRADYLTDGGEPLADLAQNLLTEA